MNWREEKNSIGKRRKTQKRRKKRDHPVKWSNRGIFGQQVKYMGAILENQGEKVKSGLLTLTKAQNQVQAQ